MVSRELRRIAAAAASINVLATFVTIAPSYADCGDPDQSPCTGPVPSVDQVLAVLSGLTDPDIPAATKNNIVTPGFTPDEAGLIDNHLNRMNAHGHILPLPFVVTDIQPAPNNLAGATLATTGTPRQATNPRPIVLVGQGGRWLLAHDSAMAELDVFWRAASR